MPYVGNYNEIQQGLTCTAAFATAIVQANLPDQYWGVTHVTGSENKLHRMAGP